MEVPDLTNIASPRSSLESKSKNVQLSIVELPLTYTAPPSPHGVEVLLNLEFLTVALSTLIRYSEPPPNDAAVSAKLLESTVMLVESIHEMEPPYLLASSPANVRLYNAELLQFIRDNAPPFARASISRNLELEMNKPSAVFQ